MLYIIFYKKYIINKTGGSKEVGNDKHKYHFDTFENRNGFFSVYKVFPKLRDS